MKINKAVFSLCLLFSSSIIFGKDCCRCSKIDCSNFSNGSKTELLPPRWLQGITVKNSTDKDIKVMADGGNVNGYITIGAGKEKLVDSRGDIKRGIRFVIDGVARETSKYEKPDYIEIKSEKIYNAVALDKTENMGTWTALKPSSYNNQETKKVE